VSFLLKNYAGLKKLLKKTENEVYKNLISAERNDREIKKKKQPIRRGKKHTKKR